MKLTGKRSLAWVLKWLTTLAILFWAAILIWVWPVGVRESLRPSSVVPDFPISYHWTYPGPLDDVIRPITADKEVIELESHMATLTFRTEGGTPVRLLGLSGLTVMMGLLMGILWLLRKVLGSLVEGQPLTEVNARRFRWMGILIVGLWASMALFGILGHMYLQSNFDMPPNPGLSGPISLIMTLPTTKLFLGLLIILMAEVMRLGAEHRADSEAVV
jgi:hypothetical protein